VVAAGVDVQMDVLYCTVLYAQVDRELEFPMKELENKAKAPGAAGLFGSAWGALGWGSK